MRVRGIAAAVLISLVGLITIAATGEHGDPRRTAVLTAEVVPGVGPGDPPSIETAIVVAQDAFFVDQQRQIDEYLAWQYEQDVAAWAAAHPPRPEPRATPAPHAAPVEADYSGGDCDSVHWAAREIYMAESGCRPEAVNPGGCRGIGQACPGSKLPCGPDFACQHAWFTGYMLERYGTWEAALAFKRSRGWW